MLLETRVKQEKATSIQNRLGLHCSVIDNYSHHVNGRVWVLWDRSKVDLKCVSCTAQLIHCGVYSPHASFLYWLTAIYTYNQLDQQRLLWRDLERLHHSSKGLGV